jgi:hypothetical protein
MKHQIAVPTRVGTAFHPDPLENAIAYGIFHLMYHIERAAQSANTLCKFCERRAR